MGSGVTSLARGASVVVKKTDGFDPAAIKRAAFLPLVRVLPVDEDAMIAVCPFGRSTHDAGTMGDAAEAELSRAIGQAIGDNPTSVSWVPAAEINAARSRLESKGGETLSPGGPLQLAIGRELGVDAVLFGFVYYYRDRSGSAYASAHPARVAFCLHLVDPTTGKDLWTFSYADEQKALTENLLEAGAFFRRKGRWITAQEMAEEAAAVAVKSLPWAVAEPKKDKK